MADTKAFYEIPIDDWPAYQQFALERLHLKFTGVVHQIFLDLGKNIAVDLEHAGGGLSGIMNAMQRIEATWKGAYQNYVNAFEAARWEAATIALASVARYHLYFLGEEGTEERGTPYSLRELQDVVERNRKRLEPYILKTRKEKQEAHDLYSHAGHLQEASEIPYALLAGSPFGGPLPFQASLEQVLEAARDHIWSDGWNLSGRIWRLDQTSLEGLRQTLYAGMAQEMSVWELAQAVEQYLGANASCPRWTIERLGLSPEEIAAGNRTGLVSADPCTCQGVAYNALRLARTEIQVAHHRALALLFAAMPWVDREQIILHPFHPWGLDCECEWYFYNGKVVAGIGQGIWPQGTILLPLHPHCMCTLKPILMDREEFLRRYNDWRMGVPWSEWDAYLHELGLMPFGLLPGAPPPPSLGWADSKSLWWLLLLLLAEAYRRWAEANESETSAALEGRNDAWR